jgi:hypothetical protein
MCDEQLRAGEPQLLAFISSVMDKELAPARECVEQTLGRAPFLLAWTFEHTPASAQDVQEAYLEKVRRSAFVFWLVGSRTTDPVANEIDEALACRRRLIVLVLPAEHRDDATVRLLERVRTYVKYRELASVEDLAAEVDRAVSDEISRALADLPGMSRAARLDELGRASRARCVERWQVAGVDTTLALAMAHELGLGAAPAEILPSKEQQLRVLCGDMGVGKSLAGERYHQAAIAAQLLDANAPVPVYLRARDIDGDLQATALQACEGLGDPRQQGAIVVLDGIDEPGTGAASELLSQARVLTGTWPATRVLLSSRPLSAIEHTEELAHLQQLDEPEASSLIGRVAGIAVTTGIHAGWPENLRQAIRLPLFAIGRVDADVAPLLRRLAILSLRRGGGPVPEADVLAGADPGLIEGTRLVVRRDRTLVFPLIVLAQWFAAESLIAGEPTPQELIDDPAGLEPWRYPLAIAVGTYGYAQVGALLGPLAAAHGGFASQVVEEGLAKWSQSDDVMPPPAVQCAEEIRSATEAWLQGAASLKELFWPLVRDGQLAPTGAHVDGAWLTTGWYAGARQLPNVSELPGGGFAVLLAPGETELDEWANIHGARPGRQAAWAWRWSFEQLRAALKAQLKARVLRLIDGPLADAEIWGAVCSMMSLPFTHDEAIPIQPISDAIPDDAELLMSAGGRRILDRGIPAALHAKLADGTDTLDPPFPGPDQTQGGWVWSGWSEQRMLERTQAVFTAAIHGYEWLAASQLQSLAPWMQTAVTLPAVLHGYLNPGDPTRGFASGPTIEWWLEALPAEQPSRVEIELEHEDRREEHHAMFVEQARRSRTQRTQQRAWLDSTSHSSMLDVFGLFSTQETVYKWLWDDLKRIRWVDGNLGERPRM